MPLARSLVVRYSVLATLWAASAVYGAEGDTPQLLISNGNGLAVQLEESTVEIRDNGDVHIKCLVGPTGGCGIDSNGGTVELPSVSLAVNDPALTLGQAMVLSWSSNAELCVGQGTVLSGWGGQFLSPSGTKTIYPPAGTHSPALKCYSQAGSVTRAAGPVVVSPGTNPAPVIHELYAAPALGPAPLTTRVSWGSSFATSCTASGAPANVTGWNGSLPILGDRLLTFPANGTTTLTLTCTGTGGTTSRTTTVTVGSPPPPPSCTGITVPNSALTRQDLTWDGVFNRPFPVNNAIPVGLGNNRTSYGTLAFVPQADQVYTLTTSEAVVTPTNPTAEPASDAVITVSHCPGDFRAPVSSAPANDPTLALACRQDGRSGALVFGNAGCPLVAGQTYYINIAMKTSFAAVTQSGHTCGSRTACEVNATMSNTRVGDGGEACTITHPLIKPAGFTAHVREWSSVFFGAQFPRGQSHLSPIGAFSLKSMDPSRRGPSMSGRYITIPVTLEPNSNYRIAWVGAQPIPAAQYNSARVSEAVFVSASPCSGDLRPGNTFSPDPHIKNCRAQLANGNLFFGTTSTHQCRLAPGLNFITIAMVNPSDGLTPFENTCANTNFDGTVDRCEANFQGL